jgi:hypothetical protein
MRSTSIIRRIVLQGAAAVAFWLGFGRALAGLGSDLQRPSSPFERFRWSFFEDRDSARNGLGVPALWTDLLAILVAPGDLGRDMLF